MGEIDKINELPEPDELPPANEDSAEYKAGSRLAKRVNRATEKRWIGIVDGPTHRSRHTLIWRDGPLPAFHEPEVRPTGDDQRHSMKPEFRILLNRSRLRQELRAIYRADSALP
jgi:hypothetical protein